MREAAGHLVAGELQGWSIGVGGELRLVVCPWLGKIIGGGAPAEEHL
jgi:hypothetical protein